MKSKIIYKFREWSSGGGKEEKTFLEQTEEHQLKLN